MPSSDRRGGEPAPGSGPEHDDGRDDIGQGNSLQHARDAHGAQPGKTVDGIEQQAQHEQHRGPDKNVAEQPAAARALTPLGERERQRDADDEDKAREHDVGERRAIPGGMHERPIDGAPVARIVDEDHGGDRQTPEHIK